MEPTMTDGGFMGMGSVYYRPSGRFGAGGIPVSLFLGAAAGVVLGVGHGYLTRYNPYIYFNFLATFALGFVIGVAVIIGARAGKIRAPWLAGALGAACGLVGLYAAWVAWIHVLLVQGKVDMPTWIVAPAALWRVIKVVNENGAWSLGSGDTPTTGALLWVLWAIEAAVIVGVAAAVSWSWVNTTPFCEPCDAWTEKEIKAAKLGPAASIANLKQSLEAKEFRPLAELGQATPALFTEMDLLVCPRCRQVGFLTVRNVAITVDKRKKQQVSKTDVVKNLTIEAEYMEKVRGIAGGQGVTVG